MTFEIIEAKGRKVAEVPPGGPVIDTVQDALDLIANAQYRGASHVILHESGLTPAFFDLTTGLAGEVLQKFTNYRMGLAVVGDFDKFGSASLQALIAEANRGAQVAFVPDREAALAKITG